MKVILLQDMPEEKWPSMDIYSAKLSEALRKLNKQLELEQFVLHRPLPKLSGKMGQALTYFWRFTVYPWHAKKQKADIYHIIDHSYGHVVYALKEKRTVVTCHDLAPLVLRGRFKSGISERLWDFSIQGLKQATKIIAISENTKKDIKKYLGLKDNKINVIYYGIDKTFNVLDKEKVLPLRKKLIGEADFVILHVGHCHWRKNVEAILKTLPLLKKEKINFVFLQVGGKWNKSQKELIAKLGIADSIKQINYLESKLLPQVYNLADVFVFPSWYEGFGLPPLEAMACGTPVIVSNVSSLPEVVGEAALTVEPNDIQALAKAIVQVLLDERLREELKKRGIKQASRFDWQETAKKTLAVYEEVMAK